MPLRAWRRGNGRRAFASPGCTGLGTGGGRGRSRLPSVVPGLQTFARTAWEQLQTANQSLGGIRAEDVGIFTALINLVENSQQHCSDYPAW